MKLQSWVVIFAIIVIPIVLVMSLYIQVQINYINLQGNYDTILNNATYDAIKAFQINELNSTTQNIAQEKIRDVEASVTTFYNSLATNFGQSGYSEEELQSYIPALVYTLYDGYYIYTKYNNVVAGENNGSVDINLNSTESATGLKPYVYYSARYRKNSSNREVVINYTLDNYITVFYNDGSNNYQTYSGFLIDTSKTNAEGTRYDGINIDSELLSEVNRTSYEANKLSPQKIPYRYFTNNNRRREKAYWDGSKWYKYNVDGTINTVDEAMVAQLGGTSSTNDTSAQEYLKESYAFTNQMKSLIGDFTLGDIIDVNKEDLGITGDIGSQSIIDFNAFSQHKQQVIRNSINTNLRATIAKFNENSTYPAKMPTLTENEWAMILSNTCLISFMQGQNIGNGLYMGYSIVTNNKNREFIDPKLIYILDQNNSTYHDVRHLSASLSSNIIGYRNTDFDPQSFVATDGSTKNYYRHANATADYACIVTSAEITSSNGATETDNALGNRITELDTILDSASPEIRKAYYTALFRERYNSYKSLQLSGI